MHLSKALAAALSCLVALAFTVVLSSPVSMPRGGVPSAPSAAAGASGYAYFPPNNAGRVSVTWDRSVPVTYVIARRNARPRMFATIKEAFRRARVQTGIRFTYGGRAATSRQVGTVDRPVVLVDFGTARSHPRLAKYDGVIYAVGGPFLLSNGTTGVFTGGQITIDVASTRGIGRSFRHCQLGATLMHEIGHVLGLDHVSARGQLMAPGRIRANISGWFHDGDLRGLERLIRG